MRIMRRVRAVAAVAATTGRFGPGVVNRLAAAGDPDPPPYPACGGYHALVIEEVVVHADEPGGAAR